MNRMTKKYLANQLIEFCDIKPLREITIKNFIEYANISKQTFYNHFKDKADLMNYAFEIAAQNIMMSMDPSIGGMFLGALKQAQECLKYQRFYTQMALYKTQNSFEEYFSASVEAVYKHTLIHLGYMAPDDRQKSQVVRNFCIGICSFYLDWMRSGMKESPEYVADTIIASMPKDIWEIFSNPPDV